MDFYLFEGKTKPSCRRPINLGGSGKSTFNKQDLLDSIEQERRTREHLRNLADATTLAQRYIIHQYKTVMLRKAIVQDLFVNMNAALDSIDKGATAFLPHFRMIIFGRQIIPETRMYALMQHLREDKLQTDIQRSIYFLFIKYCLLNCKSLLDANQFVVFLFENFDTVIDFGYFGMLERFLSVVSLSLHEIVDLLKRFSQSHIKFVFAKLFRSLASESNPKGVTISLLKDSDFCRIFVDNLICLQSFMELFREFPPIQEILTILPFKFTQSIDTDSSQLILDLFASARCKLYPKWLFGLIYCNSACQDDEKYFDSFCEFISHFLSESQAIVCEEETFTFHDRLGKLGLSATARETVEDALKRVSFLIEDTAVTLNFLHQLIKCTLIKTSQQLSSFSTVFLYFQFSPLLYDYSFERDEMLRTFVKKFHSCHGASYKYLAKNIMLAMVAFLDRENCIREFSKIEPLFPPGSCLLSPISGLLDERQTLFSYSSPLPHRIDIFYQFCRAKMRSLPHTSPVLEVRRGYEFEDAMSALSHLGPRSFVKYRDESGFGRGVTTEFVVSALSQALQIDLGAFQVTPDQKLFPSSLQQSSVMFELIGKLIGIALMLKIRIDQRIKFDFAFLSACRTGTVTVDDLFFLDSQMYRSLIYLSKHSAADLFLTFSLTSDALDGKREIDLIPGGSCIPVTDDNKTQYIELLASYKLHTQSIESLLKGLCSLIPHERLEMFNEAELCMMISGLGDEIDLADWKSNTIFHGPHKPENVQTFWQAVELLSPKERSELLRFATGCPRPPLMGFEMMNPHFTVIFTQEDLNKLPEAHTCFNNIIIPCYDDASVAAEKMRMAIANLSAGFQAA